MTILLKSTLPMTTSLVRRQLTDLLEGELLPDLEDEDLALLIRQATEGGFDFLAALVTFTRQSRKNGTRFLDPTLRSLLAGLATFIAARQIEGSAADRDQ